MNISYLLISCNRKNELLRAISSIYECEREVPYEIIVLDNQSDDGTSQAVADQYPDVKMLRSETNLGVPGGRNRIAAMATGDLFVFLDDDTVMRSPFVTEHLIEYFTKIDRLGALAFHIFNQPAGRVVPREFPGRDPSRIKETFETTYFVGAGFAVRKTVFEECGLFWNDLFFALEELELSYRMLDRGFRIFYTPDIEVVHYASPSARPSARWHEYNMRSRLLVAYRNLPFFEAVVQVALWTAAMIGHGLIHGHLTAILKGWVNGWRALPDYKSFRKPIQRDTIRRIKRLRGRIWF